MTTFLKRKIDVTFQLGTGSFGEGLPDTIKISGHRVSASIVKAGGQSMGESQFTIYGMRPTYMNKLSTLGLIPQQMPEQRRNTVIIEAGDDVNGMAVVFVGTIANAYFNAQAAPDVSFTVIAYAGLLQALKSVPTTCVKGPVDVATVMGGLVDQVKGPDLSGLENNGVNVQLPTSYFKGTAREQMRACADAANINWTIDNARLAIWPRPGKRVGFPAPVISPDTGMVGYPIFNVQGIDVHTLFNPSITFGAEVKIEQPDTAVIKQANGTWYVYTLYYDLDSEIPNGKWFTRFLASPPGYVAVTR